MPSSSAPRAVAKASSSPRLQFQASAPDLLALLVEPPTGSISDPSQASTRRSRSVGRMKRNSGAITVGPDTTRMAPVISAAPADTAGVPSRCPGELTWPG
jgi:hypothetical protein